MLDHDADLPAHIDRVLANFLRQNGDPLRQHDPIFTPVLDALTDFVLGGGKRLRPTFAWWAWRGVGGDQDGEQARGVLQAVASLELIQACALIHDDLIDSSDSRRGSPTVHVSFAAHHAEHSWLGSPAAFGQAAAILIGDVALAWADDMFSEAALPSETLARGRKAWQAMRSEVLAGQYLDVHTQATGDTSVETALRINRLKTAAYTVQRPLHLGAALAGADDAVLDPLLNFGSDLGVAFQLRDDLLGVFGDPAVTGKPAGDDLREGKRTLLVALGLRYAKQQGRNREAEVIMDGIGNAKLTESGVRTMRQVLTDVGAVSEIERRIEQLTDDALTALHRAELTPLATERLTELAHQATRRTS